MCKPKLKQCCFELTQNTILSVLWFESFLTNSKKNILLQSCNLSSNKRSNSYPSALKPFNAHERLKNLQHTTTTKVKIFFNDLCFISNVFLHAMSGSYLKTLEISIFSNWLCSENFLVVFAKFWTLYFIWRGQKRKSSTKKSLKSNKNQKKSFLCNKVKRLKFLGFFGGFLTL